MRVDPAATSFRLSNPQTWNRYAYALNTPLTSIDPDGRNPIVFLVVAGVAGGLLLGAEPANAPMSESAETVPNSGGGKGIAGAAAGVIAVGKLRAILGAAWDALGPSSNDPCMGPCGDGDDNHDPDGIFKERSGPGPEKKKFDRAQDAQDQFEEISERQRKIRQGKAGGIIESTEKSEQREKNALKSINFPADAEEEEEFDGFN